MSLLPVDAGSGRGLLDDTHAAEPVGPHTVAVAVVVEQRVLCRQASFGFVELVGPAARRKERFKQRGLTVLVEVEFHVANGERHELAKAGEVLFRATLRCRHENSPRLGQPLHKRSTAGGTINKRDRSLHRLQPVFKLLRRNVLSLEIESSRPAIERAVSNEHDPQFARLLFALSPLRDGRLQQIEIVDPFFRLASGIDLGILRSNGDKRPATLPSCLRPAIGPRVKQLTILIRAGSPSHDNNETFFVFRFLCNNLTAPREED